MPSDSVDIHISTGRRDRRALMAHFCDELGRVLAGDQDWERDATVVPWHASAATFEGLPARVAEAILGEWAETGGTLGAIELGGYLETDHGPRAWGSLAVDETRPSALAPELERCAVEPGGEGYRIEARLRIQAMDGADA